MAKTGLAVVLCSTLAHAETLTQTVADAYLYNPSLEAARAQLRALGETVPIAEAGRLPSLSVTGNSGFSRTAGLSSFGFNTATSPLSLQLNGSVPLYDGGESANAISEARANVESSYATLNGNEQALILSAISAFFDVLRDREIRNLTRENLRVLRQELEASEARFEVGEVTLTDVAQTKSRVAEANSNVIQADGLLRVSAENFRLFVGRLPGELMPPNFLPALPKSVVAAESEALANDPSIVATRAAERAAVYAIRQAMAGKLPQVTLSSTVTGGSNDLLESDPASITTQLNLSISAPLYQGGATDAAVRRARHIASQRRAQYHEAVRTAQEAVNRAWHSLATSRGAIEAGKERVSAADLAFEGIKEELLVGSRATIDLLNAEQERLNARIALVRSVRDLNVFGYSLLAAMGRLTPESLGVESVDEAGNGIAGVEPTDRDGYPKTSTVAWRFPWRP